MNSRINIPNRRPGTMLSVVYGDNEYYVCIGQTWRPGSAAEPGFYDLRGPPVEVFVQARQTSSQVESLARDAAILASFALQFGSPLPAIVAAMTREEDGSPASLVGAMLDAIHAAFPPEPPSDDPTRQVRQ